MPENVRPVSELDLERARRAMEEAITDARILPGRPTESLNWINMTAHNSTMISERGTTRTRAITNRYYDRIEDPSAIVETVGGKKHPAGECIFFDGRYYHRTHKDVFKDFFTGEYFHIVEQYNVASKFKVKSNGKLKVEHETIHVKNIYKTIPIYSGKHDYEGRILSTDVIEGWEYKESLSEGKLVDADFEDRRISDVREYETFKNSTRGCIDPKTRIQIGEVSPSYTISEGLKYTFGIEFECSRGYIPQWLAEIKKYNMLCVRDGSINNGEGGPEYVTGILTGDTGFKHLQDICLELSKRTMVNASCGVHVHIGGINFSKQFLVNSYRLALFLEKEIFSTLPPSRRNNRYCRKLKKLNFRPALSGIEPNIALEEDYNALFAYMSLEKAWSPGVTYNKKKQHPLGAKCGYNRDTPRYCWLNYIPAMFNTRENGSYSLETRCHPGSTNFTKIKNWILFNFAFIAFVERHPEEIVEGITMETVINRILPKKAKSLNRYFTLRKELFTDENKEAEEYKASKEEKLSIKELITS